MKYKHNKRGTSKRMMVKHNVFNNQGNKDRQKYTQMTEIFFFKIHEAVQNVTPIKYHV